jgi:fructose transport system permease protein
VSDAPSTSPAPHDAAEELLDRRTPVQPVQSVLHEYPWLCPAVVLVLAVVIFSSMVMAKTSFGNGVPGWASIILALVVGVAAGAGNGFLVTRVKLPPFIVTLGTLGIFTSLTLLCASGRTVRNRELAPWLTWLGTPIDVGGFRAC